jgi:ubiquinone/menaquinone biosynthesis C-methylase UbiE
MADDDQKQLVALGYDRIADSYLERFGRSSVRAAKLAELIEQLPAGASILDVVCGAGIPVAHELVTLGFSVTGVDASRGQIERARRNVSRARFIHADMAAVQFAPESFDAVAAFYSVSHLPKSEHGLSAASRNGFDVAADSLPTSARQREIGQRSGLERLCFLAIMIPK